MTCAKSLCVDDSPGGFQANASSSVLPQFLGNYFFHIGVANSYIILQLKNNCFFIISFISIVFLWIKAKIQVFVLKLLTLITFTIKNPFE